MQLRGIDFGNVLGTSGVQGFFGEGYWFHKPWQHFGLNFDGMTFVSKTATLEPREGNMALREDYTPRDMIPDCVKAKFWRGVMLNSVGLSNPGIQALLDRGEWQKRTKPFFISIMSLADSPAGRLDETQLMVEILGNAKHGFSAPFGVQQNVSCPNTAHNPAELIGETAKTLNVVSSLKVPLMPKFSIASAPIEAIMELNDNPDCDAICVSNTLPFGWKKIDWKKAWGTTTSPLEKYGGGGLSGAPLRPLVCKWIERLHDAGFTKPINGGGGILSFDDVRHYYRAGASSIFLGSIATQRPWRVKSIIQRTNILSQWEEK